MRCASCESLEESDPGALSPIAARCQSSARLGVYVQAASKPRCGAYSSPSWGT